MKAAMTFHLGKGFSKIRCYELRKLVYENSPILAAEIILNGHDNSRMFQINVEHFGILLTPLPEIWDVSTRHLILTSGLL